jgi:hypothetical protein
MSLCDVVCQRVRSVARPTNIGTQGYAVIQSSLPVLYWIHHKTLQIGIVAYAVIWISHFELWDVKLVHDASWKSRYFLHSPDSFCTQDKLLYIDENYHASDTVYITTIFHALFVSNKMGVF